MSVITYTLTSGSTLSVPLSATPGDAFLTGLLLLAAAFSVFHMVMAR